MGMMQAVAVEDGLVVVGDALAVTKNIALLYYNTNYACVLVYYLPLLVNAASRLSINCLEM
jgi:hypothetical protein